MVTGIIFHWIGVFNEAFSSWDTLPRVVSSFAIVAVSPLFLLAAVLLALPLFVSLFITIGIALFDKSSSGFFEVYIEKLPHIFYYCSDVMVPLILFAFFILHLWSNSKRNEKPKRKARSMNYEKRHPTKKKPKRKR